MRTSVPSQPIYIMMTKLLFKNFKLQTSGTQLSTILLRHQIMPHKLQLEESMFISCFGTMRTKYHARVTRLEMVFIFHANDAV